MPPEENHMTTDSMRIDVTKGTMPPHKEKDFPEEKPEIPYKKHR